MKPELSKTQQRRLDQMNRRLNPAYMEYRRDTGKFQFVLSKNGRKRKTLSNDLELSYEAALLLREKYLNGNPLFSSRSISLGVWYEHLKEEREKLLAKTTMDIEKYYWAELGDDIRNMPLDKITQEDIDAELDEIEAPSQRDHTAVFIRTVLNAAVKKGLLDKSPFRYTRQKRAKKKVPTLSQNQLISLCQAVPNDVRPAVLLASYCGLRRGEIMALQYQDVDLIPESMQVHIHKSKTRVEGTEHIVEPKAGSSRVVPIMPDIPDVALDMVRTAFTGHPPEEFIFPIFKSKIHNTVRQTCKREGLPLVGLHDLRHICGTHWVINHGMAFASAALGHSSIQMTIDVYADLDAIIQARTKVRPLQHPLIPKAIGLANELVEHNDPSVRELALLTLQVCG